MMVVVSGLASCDGALDGLLIGLLFVWFRGRSVVVCVLCVGCVRRRCCESMMILGTWPCCLDCLGVW